MKFRRIFHLLLGMTYVGLGVYMYMSQILPLKPWGYVLCGAFVVYGVWRMYRSTKITD